MTPKANVQNPLGPFVIFDTCVTTPNLKQKTLLLPIPFQVKGPFLCCSLNLGTQLSISPLPFSLNTFQSGFCVCHCIKTAPVKVTSDLQIVKSKGHFKKKIISISFKYTVR